MPSTLQELDNFHHFAADQLRNPDSAASLEELLGRWRAARERGDANAAIAEGLSQMKAGRGRPLDDFIAEFRAEHNIPADA